MLKAIVNGRILLPESEVLGKALLFDKKIIGIVDEEIARAQAEEIIDAQGLYVAPGLVDTHIHGYQDADVSDADPDGVRRMAKGLLENGVTSFLPTSLTVAWETLETVCQQLRQLREESLADEFEGSEILGMHMEGPFINPSKKGAQNEAYIQPMDPEKVLPHADIIKVLTCAPEMPNGDHFVRVLKAKTNIKLSIGHTGANYDQAMAAFNLGITRSTHTFNGMRPLYHRETGILGAALTDGRIHCEMIGDFIHLDPPAVRLLLQAKGFRNITLISDTGPRGGMPDGEYDGRIVKDGVCRTKDGTIAGSCFTLLRGVRNLRSLGVPLEEISVMASLNPAKALGLDGQVGAIADGYRADLILCDGDINIHKVFVEGKEIAL